MFSNHATNYRPDIDGLRAFAVLSVIGFHVSSRLVPGGFVGVDIFFVISGFLICGIIFNAIEERTFSLAEFYKGRIKRILPAYIVVSLFTLVVSSYLLIPNDFIFYTTSLAASWSFCSNIFFSLLSWGYFGQRTEEFPLLHTWSLSVEEQFYFLFPIFLMILCRKFRERIVTIFTFSAILFIAISEWKITRVGSYFLLPYRAHEMIIGALTFFSIKAWPTQRGRLAEALSFIGLGLALGSVFLLGREFRFPGVNTLFPCLGAALLIYGGAVETRVKTILSQKLLVAIGLISYSLYLWHWPILSFLRYRQIEITFFVGTLAICTSIVLAVLTWKYIEVPIRSDRQIPFKTAFFRYYATPAILFLCIGLYSYVTEGAPKRFSDDSRQLISSYSFERDLTNTCAIKSGEYKGVTLDYLINHCAFGNMRSEHPDILLYGDSHANHFKPFVEGLALHSNMKSVYFIEGRCSPLDLVGSVGENDAVPSGDNKPSTCQMRNADLLQLAGQFKYVVIASYWNYRGREEAFEKDLAAVVEKIQSGGAVPVVFKDNPYYHSDLSRCVLFKKREWVSQDKNCNIPFRYVDDTQGSMDRVIDDVKKKYPRTIVINPKLVMCNDAECVTSIGNIALFKDANHINSKAAALLAQQYLSLQGNPFLEPIQVGFSNKKL